MPEPTVDVISNSGEQTGASHNWSHAAGGSAKGVLIVTYIDSDGFNTNPGATITYGGNSCTEVTTSEQSKNGVVVHKYEHDSNVSGTNTVDVTPSSDNTILYWRSYAITFDGCDTTDCVDSSGASSGKSTSGSVTWTTNTDDPLLVGFLYMLGDQDASEGTGVTQQYDARLNSNDVTAGTKSGGTAGSKTVDWTHDNNHWMAIGVAVKEGAAGGGTTHDVTIIDTIKASDTASVEAIFLRTIADAIKLDDSINTIWTWNPSVSDGVKLDDSISTAVNFVLSSADAFFLREENAFGGPGARGFVNFILGASDAIKLSDTNSIVISINTSCSDGIKLEDAISAICTFNTNITDAIKLSDTVNTDVVFNLAVSDAVKIDDVNSANVNFILSASDAAKFADTNSISVTIEVSCADAVKFDDSLSAQCTFNVSASEGLKLSDVVSAVCNYAVSVTDGLKLSDISNVTIVEAASTDVTGCLTFVVAGKGITAAINVKGVNSSITLKGLNANITKC